MSFNDYQWHDDYERESVMRAMALLNKSDFG